MKLRLSVSVLAAMTLVASMFAAFPQMEAAQAADGSSFNAGNIVSDAVFFDGEAMSAPAVQNFLMARVPTCRSGYTCLKDFTQATPSMGSSAGMCSAYAGSSGERAADIIAKVGAACGISQKVLLVLLEKEQSLVSDTWPTSSQYRSATGFSCPDTAACDPAFSGFFYQVYYAAKQFKRYANTPNSWRYKAGQVNGILFNPNSDCGSSSVYIENQATAGLYIYTPYQPNAAALANLYGTGDGCSAYGNRNFWRIFTDWFGSTTGTSVMRSASNDTVYLVAGSVKYPIANSSMLSALSPLGGVTYVSQAYLNGLTTAQLFTRIIRGSDGSIYLIDSGIKLPFSSCAMVITYGGSCEPTGYVQMTDSQVAAYVTGPVIGSVLGTTAGTTYYMHEGKRSEVQDIQVLAENSISSPYNVLTEAAVSNLPLAAPLTRESSLVRNRGDGSYVFISAGKKMALSSADASALGAATKASGTLSGESIALIASAGRSFPGVVTVSPSPAVFVLSSQGSLQVAADAPTSSIVPVPVAASFLNLFANAGSIEPGTFIKSPDNASIYVVMNSDIRPIGSWDSLLALAATSSPRWLTLPASYVLSLPFGPVALSPGALYRNNSNETVYLINGLTDRIAFSSFVYPYEAGLTTFAFTADDRLFAYPQNEKLLKFALSCGQTKYVAAGGAVHEIAPALVSLFPLDFVALDSFTCRKLSVGAAATKFIRTSDGSIFMLDAGQKRPVSTMARFSELGGSVGWLQVHQMLADSIPTGPSA